jgi:hypothetical protein
LRFELTRFSENTDREKLKFVRIKSCDRDTLVFFRGILSFFSRRPVLQQMGDETNWEKRQLSPKLHEAIIQCLIMVSQRLVGHHQLYCLGRTRKLHHTTQKSIRLSRRTSRRSAFPKPLYTFGEEFGERMKSFLLHIHRIGPPLVTHGFGARKRKSSIDKAFLPPRVTSRRVTRNPTDPNRETNGPNLDCLK